MTIMDTLLGSGSSWAANQLNPHVPVNEGIAAALILHLRLKGKGTTTPPGSPAEGDAYILGASPTGDWSTFSENNIAYYHNGAWREMSARDNLMMFANDGSGGTKLWRYDAATPVWTEITLGGGGGGGGGGVGGGAAGWTYKETVTATGGSQVLIDVEGASAAMLVVRAISQDSAGKPRLRLSPDDGTTVRSGASEYSELSWTSAADGGKTAIDGWLVGEADGTGEINAVLQLSALDVAQATVLREDGYSAGGANVRRWGWSATGEEVKTLVLDASAGTFDQMAVDVYVLGVGGAVEVTGETEAPTAGAWTTKALDTIRLNSVATATVDLAAETITLPAGTYDLAAHISFWKTNTAQARIYDVTAAAEVLRGPAIYSGGGGNYAAAVSAILGRATFGVQTTLRLEYYVANAGNIGNGAPDGGASTAAMLRAARVG